MKILEIIVEDEDHAHKKTKGKGQNYSVNQDMDKHYADSLGRVDSFHHPNKADKTHAQYRLMMAAGESDGSKDQNLTTDANSFAGVNNFNVPYTEIEEKMLDAAYDHLGIKANKNITGDKKRHENDDVHKISPIQPRGPITLKKK